MNPNGARIRARFRGGATLGDLAAEFGLTKATIHYHIYGRKRPPRLSAASAPVHQKRQLQPQNA